MFSEAVSIVTVYIFYQCILYKQMSGAKKAAFKDLSIQFGICGKGKSDCEITNSIAAILSPSVATSFILTS